MTSGLLSAVSALDRIGHCPPMVFRMSSASREEGGAVGSRRRIRRRLPVVTRKEAVPTKTRRPHISKRRLEEMIEAATVDCYSESEQMAGWFTMIDDTLAVPFETTVLGVSVTVERVNLTGHDQVVAVCTRGRHRQALPILDLPLPTPPPDGAEWIEAYRRWQGAG